MVLPGRDIGFKQFLLELYREWNRDGLVDVAGSLTYFGILALFPFLLCLVSIASLVIDPRTAQVLVDQLAVVAPPDVTSIVGDRIQALGNGGSPQLLTFSALGAIWAASSGVSALMRALNRVYAVTESRPWWKVQGIALLVTLAAAALSIVATAVTVASPALAARLGGEAGSVLLWLRLPVAGLLMMLVWALLYFFLPDVQQTFKFITPGSVIGVAIWLVASLGFSIYVQNFGHYEVSYGALGGVIVLLLWMYISSVVVLLGAEINAVLEHRSPEGKRVGARSLAEVGPDVPKSEKLDKELPAPRAVGPAVPVAFEERLGSMGLGTKRRRAPVVAALVGLALLPLLFRGGARR